MLQRLRGIHPVDQATQDAGSLVTGLLDLANQFGVSPSERSDDRMCPVGRDDLRLICFDHVCGQGRRVVAFCLAAVSEGRAAPHEHAASGVTG